MNKLFMVSLSVLALSCVSQTSAAESVDAGLDVDVFKNGVIERCLKNENNTKSQCECFADELFVKFDPEFLARTNSYEATDEEMLLVKDWVASEPCGVIHPVGK